MLSPLIEPAQDRRPAAWLTRAAGDFGTLHSMVPDVFAAYARVFHPAALCEHEVRWAAVAAANGRTMHGAAEWGQLTGSWRLEAQDGLWDSQPRHGHTPERQALRMAAVLARHTETPQRCWFAVWDGWWRPDVLVAVEQSVPPAERARLVAEAREHHARQSQRWAALIGRSPCFEMPSRCMRLLGGPLAELAGFYGEYADAPSIFWPEDRAWCVGSDVDLMSTYFGGSAAAVEALVCDAELEALEIPARQDVTWEADRINPSAGPPPF